MSGAASRIPTENSLGMPSRQAAIAIRAIRSLILSLSLAEVSCATCDTGCFDLV